MLLRYSSLKLFPREMASVSFESNRGFGSLQSKPAPDGPRPKQAIGALVSHRSRVAYKQLYENHVFPLISAGRYIDAEPALNLLFQANTSIPDVYKHLMDLAVARGNHKLVETYCRHWLAHPSTNLVILKQQAKEADRRGFFDLARPLFLSVLKHLPDDVEFIKLFVCQLIRDEQFEEARLFMSEFNFIKLNPDAFLILLDAICAFELGFMVEAVSLARTSLATEPSALAHVAISAILDEQGFERNVLDHLEYANNCTFNQAFCLWLIPRLSVSIYLRRKNFCFALESLEKALSYQPNSHSLKYKLGELYLLQGNLSAGFNVWANLDNIRVVNKSLKCGLVYFQDLSSNFNLLDPLLLVADCSLGDTLLFCRYAIWLALEKSFVIKFFVHPPLVNFFRTSFISSIEILPVNQLQFQRKGAVLSLLAAPGVFGACDQIPILQKPVLNVDPGLVDIWRTRLNLDSEVKLIAINWHGSAMQSVKEGVPSDIPLESFSPLAAMPNFKLISLQKGFGTNQLTNCSFSNSFVNCQLEITKENRFEWMAALISICDWVVCDDSGPAHLAASLNVPTLLLATQRLGWRWQGTSGSSYWYPSVTSISPDPCGNWISSFSRICKIISTPPTAAEY